MKRYFRWLALCPVLLTARAGAETIQLHVNGLVCAFCARGIEKKLRKLPATADVVVSLEQRLVAVALKDHQDSVDADLRKALTDSGYTVTGIERTEESIEAIRARLKQAKP